jgi:hypothetical protein
MRIRFVGFVSFVHLVMCSGPANAQEILPRFDLRLQGEYLVADDRRLKWDFEFGAEVDALDWGGGRATFVAGYEAVAGREFRRFDVNQGNYALEAVLAFRARGVEIGPVWHHVSRHLSDRAKRFPIDWNMIAVRARAGPRGGRAGLAWQVDARRTVTSAFVDYEWEVEGGAAAARPVAARWTATAAASMRAVAVDGSRGRGTQWGGRLEAGVRLEGRAGGGELFVAVERRVDPHPDEFGTARFVTAGLRLRSR